MTAHLQQQSLRMTQLVEDFHPVLRRRAFTSIRTSFPTFFLSQAETNNIPSTNESQKLITENFHKINQIIDLVDQHIRRRIQCYQNEVVNVVQKQIQQMREETQKVVLQFNSMIQEKNKENQIWSLNNELDYFKSEAKKLFDQNKELRKQNSQMKKKFQQYQWELQNREVIMQKLWYKYQKQKHHKGKLKTKMEEEIQNIQKQASQKRKQSRPDIMEFSIKEDAFNVQEMSQLKINSFKSYINQTSPKKASKIEQKSAQKEKSLIENYDNSLLIMDYEDESEISKIEYKGKSISLNKQKPQVKDQQSQVNIYLSEHSYKSLFEKKPAFKKSQKLMKQTAIQTQNFENPFNDRKRENETRQSSIRKGKQISFIRNGFYVNDVPSSKNHFRSISSQFISTKRQRSNNIKDGMNKKDRLATEINFNKPLDEDFQIQLVTHKSSKPKQKLYHKMAVKFQRNKIVERAYEKAKLNNSVEI